jgi:uncharacterized protein
MMTLTKGVREMGWRLLFFLVGIFILGFGVSLTIKADLGAGAWDALNVGLSQTIGLTVGSWVIIVGGILIFVNAFMLKQKPVYLSLITIILIGLVIDFWLVIVLENWYPRTFAQKLTVLGSGIVIVALGVAIYLQAQFPLNPVDQFMIAIKERFGVKLMTAKTIAELTALLFAFFFQGPIGIGTIIITLFIGPLIQFFYPPFHRFMQKVQPIH